LLAIIIQLFKVTKFVYFELLCFQLFVAHIFTYDMLLWLHIYCTHKHLGYCL